MIDGLTLGAVLLTIIQRVEVVEVSEISKILECLTARLDWVEVESDECRLEERKIQGKVPGGWQ